MREEQRCPLSWGAAPASGPGHYPGGDSSGQGWSRGCPSTGQHSRPLPQAAQALHLEGHGRNNHPDTQNWKNPSRRTYLTSITQFLQDWGINKIIGKYLVGFCPTVSVQGWATSNQRGKYRPKFPVKNKKQLQDPPLLLPHSGEPGWMRGAGRSAVRRNNIYWGENILLQRSVQQILCLHQVK